LGRELIHPLFSGTSKTENRPGEEQGKGQRSEREKKEKKTYHCTRKVEDRRQHINSDSDKGDDGAGNEPGGNAQESSEEAPDPDEDAIAAAGGPLVDEVAAADALEVAVLLVGLEDVADVDGETDDDGGADDLCECRKRTVSGGISPSSAAPDSL
jgi:hypothetical protein